MKTVLIIKKEDNAQTLQSVQILPMEVKESMAEYILSAEEFLHCINVANNLSETNIDGEYSVSQEFKELAEDVMDCITCGEYFIVKGY